MKMARTDKFNPVEVTKSFLGIKKGTILKFDEHSSRYISRTRDEEIGDDSYYYSGSAVELDPMIIEKNMDKYFKVYELPAAKPVQKIEMPIEEPKPEVAESGCKHCDDLYNDGVCHCEKQKEKEEVEFVPPRNELPKTGGDFVFECGLCHFVTNVVHVNNGLFFPATSDTSLTLTCENCGTRVKMYYIVDNEATEESKQV